MGITAPVTATGAERQKEHMRKTTVSVPEAIVTEIKVGQARRGMTAYQVAKRAGMVLSAFYKRMREPESMTLEELARLSKAVGITWGAEYGSD